MSRPRSNFGELVTLVWLAGARLDTAIVAEDRVLACELIGCLDEVARLPHPPLSRLAEGCRDRGLVALGHEPGPLLKEDAANAERAA